MPLSRVTEGTGPVMSDNLPFGKVPNPAGDRKMRFCFVMPFGFPDGIFLFRAGRRKPAVPWRNFRENEMGVFYVKAFFYVGIRYGRTSR